MAFMVINKIFIQLVHHYLDDFFGDIYIKITAKIYSNPIFINDSILLLGIKKMDQLC